MTSCYEELDEDLLKIINSYRIMINDTIFYDLFVKKHDFIYHGKKYSLVSIIPEMPHVELLLEIGAGLKLDGASIIVGTYLSPLSKKDAIREINNIRKYNGKVSSTRCSLIPKYDTTLEKEYLIDIKKMLELYKKKQNNMSSIGMTNNENFCIFSEYINKCLSIDEKRKEPKVFKCKKLVNVN